MLISSTDELKKFCDLILKDHPQYIAVDTEFMRSYKEYYPKLCLIQIAYHSQKCIIDVLEENLDLSPLKSIFYNKNITKVFHDCRQDLEALSTRFSQSPSPIFDTQIAAMLCNYYDNAVSYSKLVEQFLGITLDKLLLKKTNWMLRPLSQNKIDYALDDVVYLYQLYAKIYERLVSHERLLWFFEEMQAIEVNKINYDAIFDGLKFVHNITEDYILIAKYIVEWREKLARHFNVNRNIIINNQSLLYLIRDLACGKDISVIKQYVKEEYLQDILLNEFIVVKNCDYQYTKFCGSMSYDQSVLSTLIVFLHSLCYENNISYRLVASKNDLIKFINQKTGPIINGWRYEFFGKYVENFINGKSNIVSSIKIQDSNYIGILTKLTDNI
ncbi:ribonuclease D [Neoehrlichia mikurensis]|uniref:Ribonuclease D n=1 Tax=Neoehrlichia mikurensis TaxID=89586 RepID=A0A9Q9C0K5_9RICK|nr:ribonuclease D [Neoehrlichia mikurensis]QXK91709.1 ribonuclease D [Neoehrlichia mikurensis]QXK92921.1 ribonuclease D [Neoehrlichia mikurensis]QXK93400.1 ribonuclease D [Neoehrlichia mikurensis]UTO55650.1 ribonuclease D [Neoehrlichia mikurensis]UTO56571.1 ribonuclease D [Neoehrlichia mikurensis]